MRAGRQTWLGLCAALASLRCDAHSFGQLYTLPIPVEAYLYGASAALVASFLVIGFFASSNRVALNYKSASLESRSPVAPLYSPSVRMAARACSFFCLLLAIVAGLVGRNDAYRNINMTLFWIMFLLGLTYITPVLGNLYRSVNPWLVTVEWLERGRPGLFAGQRSWPASLSYYPAFILYVAFIWLELFGHVTPRSLSLVLLGYTILNIAGAWWFGKQAWFTHAEFFGYYFHVLGKMAPMQRHSSYRGAGLRLRQPFIGLLDEQPKHLSQLLFVLFMLSSTAFDGLRDTVVWVGLYWKHFYKAVAPLLGGDMIATYPFFQNLYAVYQAVIVPSTAFFYFAIYLLFIWFSKKLSGSNQSTLQLALYFGYTLVPIAFVYGLTHYFTLFISQGAQIIRLVSDPFGLGWNLFGTARYQVQAFLDVELVWHVQVWLILAGHIVSVYLAHLLAMTIGGKRASLVGQLPMLVLMVLLTTLGLWILSLPIQAGVVVGR